MEKYKTVRLGDVCEQISGEWGQDCSEGNGTKVLRTTNFTNIGIVKYDDVVERLIPQNKIDAKQLKKGDIILEKSGGSDTQPVGRVVYFDRDDDIFLCNNFTTALRISDNSVFSKYVFDYMFYMHKVGITEYYQNKTTGIRNLQTKAYLDRKIPLPPLSEQKHIASVLDKCSEVIAKHREMLDKYDTLIKSRFIEMFGDPYSNPMNWERKTFKEAAVRLSDGPFGSNLKSEHYSNSGIRVIRLGNIGVNEFLDEDKAFIPFSHYELLKKYTCKSGEIVIGTMGVPNLRACIIPNEIEVAINKADCVHYIPKPELLNTRFVCQYINCPETLLLASGMIHGQTRTRVSSGQIAEIPISIPPLSLQNDFADFVQQIDKSKFAVQKSLEKAETLYKSLMQEYFG